MSPCQPEASEAPVSHKSHEYLSAPSIRSTSQPEASVVTAIQKHNESCQPEASDSGVPVSQKHQIQEYLSARSISQEYLSARSIRSPCHVETLRVTVSPKHQEYTCQPESSGVTAIQKHNESCQPEASDSGVPVSQKHQSGVPVCQEHQQSL